MNTEPSAPYIDYEGYDVSHIQSSKELLGIDRQLSTAIYHLMGTFWLAPNTDQSAAVNDQLCVLRIQNLRIIDAFIMPTLPLADLNAGILMIEENGADLMLMTPPLAGLSQNRSRTIYLSRVKLGLGV